MRKFTPLLVLLALLAFTGAALAAQPAPKNFMAVLSGAGEVPARETDAQGIALIQLADGDSSLRFVLIAERITNPFVAHIHCGSPDGTGPAGVTLLPAGPFGSGSFNGVLAKGEKTAPDSPNNCGWTSMADVAAAIRSGGAYVNVHTNDGMGQPNTGPGDFPGGEIRGQLFEAGATP